MAPPDAAPRRLIVNADDFGRSHAINTAILQAHQQGILTSASLMMNEAATAAAIELARAHPTLGVGLHLTLVCGHASLPHAEIPALTRPDGSFSDNPVAAGCRYFFSSTARRQLEKEIAAQFRRFHETGLPLDHVNGHLNIHLHPVIFRILMDHADAWGIRRLRLTRDPFWLNARLARGQWPYRLSHALIYLLLASHARGTLRRRNIAFTPRVFGLLQNGRVDEEFLLKLLPRLPAGDSEIYSHPCPGRFKNELDALLSPRVRQALETLSIRPIRYQDL